MNDSGINQEHSSHDQRTEKAIILKDRARKLARKPQDTVQEFETVEVLAFWLGREKYAIGSHAVIELCAFKRITRVPCVPKFVMGIINLRGKIYSIIDLRRLFDLPISTISNHGTVIIISSGNMEIGTYVDDVIGVKQIPLARIQQDFPTLTGIQERYFYGVTPDELTIINVENLLTDPEIVVHDRVLI